MSINGTYTSLDGNQILVITSNDSSLGYFTGTFTNKITPIGEMTTILNDSNTRYAFTQHRGPTSIGIYIWQRDSNWSEVLMDYWVGSITSTNQLVMSGAQSYAVDNGEQTVVAFDRVDFSYVYA